MTARQYREALDALGLSQGAAAKAIGMKIRRMNAYANGTPIPKTVELAIECLMRRTGLEPPRWR